ncbi:hypothetical protein [Sphingobium fluviale]|uniref:Uncharacterized protein n=1 Tax=Sphingobium fluviale TaxID=2506423 RepID=A0A4Q1KED4_9SPHN|nr:hypothetical protein [Sphingobium fluviale]RXR27543.1 hypothetical protein EQG66_11710 [Sphingobium fluviale]
MEDGKGSIPSELIVKVAELELSSSLEARNRLLDENSAAFRWIFASLLTVNGGAALAGFSSDNITKCGKLVSGVSFVTGIFFALLLAYFTMKSCEKGVKPTGEIAGFWVDTMWSGEFDEELLQQRKKQFVSATRHYNLASSFVGWISAICFLVGAIAMGVYLK